MKNIQILINNNKFETIIADSFFSRLKGFLGVKNIQKNQSLLIIPCSSIHTIGMRFSITAIFLDDNYCITDFKKNIKPNSFFFSLNKKTKMVLEIPNKGNEEIVLLKGQQIKIISRK